MDDVKAYKNLFRRSIRCYQRLDLSFAVLTTIFSVVTGVSAFTDVECQTPNFQYFVGGVSLFCAITSGLPQALRVSEKMTRLKIGYLTCCRIIQGEVSTDKINELMLEIEDMSDDIPLCFIELNDTL